MTRKEALLAKIKDETFAMCKPEAVDKVYEAVNKRDWAIFCSQMGDYDQPGERVRAKEVFEKEIAEIAADKGLIGTVTIENMIGAIAKDPLYNIHEMDKEITK